MLRGGRQCTGGSHSKVQRRLAPSSLSLPATSSESSELTRQANPLQGQSAREGEGARGGAAPLGDWVAIKESNLSYHDMEVWQTTWFSDYGNLG